MGLGCPGNASKCLPGGHRYTKKFTSTHFVSIKRISQLATDSMAQLSCIQVTPPPPPTPVAASDAALI